MDGDSLADDEEVVRAIPFTKYNAQKQRISPQAFIDRAGVSMGRTAVLNFAQLRQIFLADLHRPPDAPLIATVSITVGRLKAAVGNPPIDPPASAVVVEDPVLNDPAGATDNPAHALMFGLVSETRGKLTEGQAKRVLAAADQPRFIEFDDPSFELIETIEKELLEIPDFSAPAATAEGGPPLLG